MIECLHCGADLPTGNDGDCAASISGSIMGDEYTESFYLCTQCGFYTVKVYIEPFLGEGVARFKGPMSREDGDAAVELIAQCSEPWDKKCRCKAHVEYFQGQLD